MSCQDKRGLWIESYAEHATAPLSEEALFLLINLVKLFKVIKVLDFERRH